MSDLEIMNQMFSEDHFAKDKAMIKITEVRPGFSSCEMPITEGHLNARGVVMGGAIFTLADFAAGVAANLDRAATVTQAAQIHFLSPGTGTVLFADAEVIHDGSRTSYCEVTIKDECGVLVAKATVNGIRLLH